MRESVMWSLPEVQRSGTLLVVALHGRGADETSMADFGPAMPHRVVLAAPRGPIAVDGGFTWFENRGIGRPVEESIRGTAALLLDWLDSVAADHPDVVLLGFSGGAAMAGALLLERPDRFAGAVLLSGTLPWDAGLDVSPGRLSGVPVFWSIDPEDDVIPRELVVRSEAWLRDESGAVVTERRYPGLGHAIGQQERRDVQDFVAVLAGETGVRG